VSLTDTVLTVDDPVISVQSSAGAVTISDVTINRCSMTTDVIRLAALVAAGSRVAGISVLSSRVRRVLMLDWILGARPGFALDGVTLVNSTASQLMSCSATRNVSIANVDVRDSSFADVMVGVAVGPLRLDRLRASGVAFARGAVSADLERATDVSFASVSVAGGPLIGFVDESPNLLIADLELDNVSSTFGSLLLLRADDVKIRNAALRSVRLTLVGDSHGVIVHQRFFSSPALSIESLSVFNVTGNVVVGDVVSFALSSASFDRLTGRACLISFDTNFSVRNVTVQSSNRVLCDGLSHLVYGTSDSQGAAALLSDVRIVDSAPCAPSSTSTTSSAVRLVAPRITVVESVFERLAVGAGALSLLSTTVNITRCSFESVRANRAGAAVALGELSAFSSSRRLSVAESFFQNNSGGGALRVAGTFQVSVTRSRFFSNRAAASGGAIWTPESTLNVADSVLLSNAAQIGGAIDAKDTSVVGCDLVDNRAEGGMDSVGAAIRVTRGSLRLTNSTIQRNFVLPPKPRTKDVGGVFFDSTATLAVAGTCVCQNNASITCAMRPGSTTSTNVTAEATEDCPTTFTTAACPPDGCPLRQPDLHVATSASTLPATTPTTINTPTRTTIVTPTPTPTTTAATTFDDRDNNGSCRATFGGWRHECAAACTRRQRDLDRSGCRRCGCRAGAGSADRRDGLATPEEIDKRAQHGAVADHHRDARTRVDLRFDGDGGAGASDNILWIVNPTDQQKICFVVWCWCLCWWWLKSSWTVALFRLFRPLGNNKV
jgi:hypothetical protein